ncbi:MAG: winged helix-turn-helix transcriptional regulator [Ruminococcaceae bacterium]|nr:winged helix-turn-helix transcriptional regulator [Oscillospiraceae bacterium]
MSRKIKAQCPAPPPKRAELSDNPVKLCNEISRIFRTRMREECDIDGVMSQPGARLVLSFLAISDGVSQRELVERTHLRAPTVSLIVKKMIDEGIVELKSDAADARIKRVYLTKYGRQVDRDGISNIKNMDSVALEGITDEECETLMVLLGKIRGNLLKTGEKQ